MSFYLFNKTGLPVDSLITVLGGCWIMYDSTAAMENQLIPIFFVT